MTSFHLKLNCFLIGLQTHSNTLKDTPQIHHHGHCLHQNTPSPFALMMEDLQWTVGHPWTTNPRRPPRIWFRGGMTEYTENASLWHATSFTLRTSTRNTSIYSNEHTSEYAQGPSRTHGTLK